MFCELANKRHTICSVLRGPLRLRLRQPKSEVVRKPRTQPQLEQSVHTVAAEVGIRQCKPRNYLVDDGSGSIMVLWQQMGDVKRTMDAVLR